MENDMPKNVRWTEEMDNLLREKAMQGMPSVKIAMELGESFKEFAPFSRNSVIGRAHRIKVSLTAKASKNGYKVEVVEPVAPPKKKKVFRRDPKLRVAPTEIKSEPLIKGKYLLDLRPNECRYTSSNCKPSTYIFCAEPVIAGQSLCAEHYNVCYIKRDARKMSA
jgi:hypothetical protein